MPTHDERRAMVHDDWHAGRITEVRADEMLRTINEHERAEKRAAADNDAAPLIIVRAVRHVPGVGGYQVIVNDEAVFAGTFAECHRKQGELIAEAARETSGAPGKLVATIEDAWTEVLHDDNPDTSYLEQDEFVDRLEAFRRGDFAFVGVRLVARIRFETKQGGGIHGPTITTGGLWGIEDDSGEDYFRTVAADETGELEEMLTALGIQPAYAETVAREAARDVRHWGR